MDHELNRLRGYRTASETALTKAAMRWSELQSPARIRKLHEACKRWEQANAAVKAHEQAKKEANDV